MRSYLSFNLLCLRRAFTGDWRYFAWLGFLSVICMAGLFAYVRQLSFGLATTDLSNQVPWGFYVSNFTFLLGIAGAAIMLVVFTIRRDGKLNDLAIFCVLIAIAALTMALSFLTADIGRPDRLGHVFPGWMPSGRFIALNGFLLLNLHILCYVLYCHYQNKKPSGMLYVPFVAIAVVWGLVLHTATAFLLLKLGNTTFWNQAILGPRFIAATFVAGPALIILALKAIRRTSGYDMRKKAFPLLRLIMQVSMCISLFLLLNEVLRNFFQKSDHDLSHLYFGISGLTSVLPLVVVALTLNLISFVILFLPQRRSMKMLSIACVTAIIGIWIEMSLGLVVPGFLPTPLGEITSYMPTLNEMTVSLGIWALGLITLSVLLRISVPILRQNFSKPQHPVATAGTQMGASSSGVHAQ